MKKIYLFSIQALLVLGLALTAGCSKEKEPDPNNPDTPVPDPVGTVSVSMRNAINGNTLVTPDGCWDSFHIGADNNFEGGDYYDNYEFVTIGQMKGIGNVTKIPTSGWASKVAVKPEHGYVGRCYDTYFRMYVVGYIKDASGDVIGAEVKYQSPFEPTTLNVSKDFLLFTKEGGTQTITVTTDAPSWDYYYSYNSDWISVEQNNNTLIVSVQANETLEEREGYMEIAANEKSVLITVKQEAGTLPETSAPYFVGDFYNENGVMGVVFYTWTEGTQGLIVSLNEATLAWSTVYAVTDCSDMNNGMNNMNKIKAIAGWEGRYPAFKWCNDWNTGNISGWYLPAQNELIGMSTNIVAVNAALTRYDGDLLSSYYYTYYWSSSEWEYNSSNEAYSLSFYNGSRIENKIIEHRVRAVRAF